MLSDRERMGVGRIWYTSGPVRFKMGGKRKEYSPSHIGSSSRLAPSCIDREVWRDTFVASALIDRIAVEVTYVNKIVPLLLWRRDGWLLSYIDIDRRATARSCASVSPQISL